MKIHSFGQTLYGIFIEPVARTEDDQRRAYIFNILITSTIIMSLLALISSAISQVMRGTQYDTVPLIVMTIITACFMMLSYLSKLGNYRYAAVIYLATFFLIATYPIAHWGILRPQGILTYSLIIIIAGVLLNARSAFVMTAITSLMLLLIEWLSSAGSLHFDTAWMQTTGDYNDVIIYTITFLVVAVVLWLSNCQIHQSLTRARQSENALLLERNLFEARVCERTKELERSQAEQLEELHRFAEFGRISSTLLHEIANPLTSLVLNLESIKIGRTSELYGQLYESITCMEEYVTSARCQLRQEGERGDFNVAHAIKRVTNLLQPKARTMRVDIATALDETLILNGDSAKFGQIVSNLIANAIDAYEPVLNDMRAPIEVTAKRVGKQVDITVTDHGVGILPKDLAHVFEAFHTTKPTDRGTGLGLTIVKRTIEEDFGGTIAASSNSHHGTRFVIRIPRT